MANVHQIAENFDWSRFAPVIVTPVEGGLFAIVDVQHRKTAAMLRGQKRSPVRSFRQTGLNRWPPLPQTTAQQLFHAKLAAGDPASLALAEVCAAADVEIMRGNLRSEGVRPGQTQAVGALRRCLAVYGRIWPRLSQGGIFFSHDIAYLKVLQAFNDERLWRETFNEHPPIFFGAGFGMCDSSPHLGFAVKGRVTADYIKSLTYTK